MLASKSHSSSKQEKVDSLDCSRVDALTQAPRSQFVGFRRPESQDLRGSSIAASIRAHRQQRDGSVSITARQMQNCNIILMHRRACRPMCNYLMQTDSAPVTKTFMILNLTLTVAIILTQNQKIRSASSSSRSFVRCTVNDQQADGLMDRRTYSQRCIAVYSCIMDSQSASRRRLIHCSMSSPFIVPAAATADTN